MKPRALVREAWRAAAASRAYSVLFGAVAFLVVLAVVVLSAQATSQREALHAALNQPQYRTFEVVDESALGIIDADSGARARSLSQVEQAWVTSPAFDVHSGAIPGGERISARLVAGQWSEFPMRLVAGRFPANESESILDAASASTLGLDATGGWVQDQVGRQWSVVGTFAVTQPRAPSGMLAPLGNGATTRALAVVVGSVDFVEPVAQVVTSLVGVADGARVVVDRAEDVAELRGELGRTVTGRSVTIVLTLMMIAMLILTFLSLIMVHSRRQEFGRRRALGATRAGILGLVLMQGAIVVALAGLTAGGVGALVGALRYEAAPAPSFVGLLIITAVAGTALAQVPAALAAGFRDPVRVLRTP